MAILENGAGPRLLIRTDMDALPVEEKTGLDYASTVHATNPQGQEVGVMHACGHDMHMTVLLGMAREMAARKAQWHGTLMLIGQPSEETIDGAGAMLADGLYARFGRPDFVLSEHDDPATAPAPSPSRAAHCWLVRQVFMSPCAAWAVTAPLPKPARTPSCWRRNLFSLPKPS